MGKNYRTIGKPVQEYTGYKKVTGKATYCFDYRIPNMLHAKLLRAPHARAKIVSIDCSEAKALPGVELVMCHRNFPHEFSDSVVFNGMEVACVVADSKATAKRALELIRVTYEELPFVIDPQEAEKPGAVQALPDRPNVVPWDRYRTFTDPDENGYFTKRNNGAEFDGYGDIEQGYQESEVIVEEKGYAYGYAQAPLMSNTCCLADFTDGTLTLYLDTQVPYQIRQKTANYFHLPLSRVRLISEFNGGCFGARSSSAFEPGNSGPSCTIIAAAASIALGKPVSLEYSLYEDMLFYWGRGTYDTRVAIGFNKDGTMKMMDSEAWRNASTGGMLGEETQAFDPTATGTMLYAHNCEHSRHQKNRVYTNCMGWTGWQGYGNPEIFFAVESTMDEAAEELGIDPAELRKMNVTVKGDHYLDSYYGFHGASYLSRSGFQACIDACLEKSKWKEKRKPPQEKAGVIRHGMGLSLGMMQTGGQDCASQAIVILNADGSAILYCNYQDIGQGGHSAQVQIAAETLNIPFEMVKIKAGDSDLPYSHFQISSSGTLGQGYATYNAARAAKKKLLERAARTLSVPADTLDTKDGMVFSREDASIAAPWINIMMDTMAPGECSEIDFVKSTMDIVGYGKSDVTIGPTACEQSATVVELDVDTESGEISNVVIYHAQDCGQAINPKVVEAHYLGVHHGLEAMTGCEQVLDPKTGKLLNDNWIDYPVSTFLDGVAVPIIVEVPEPTHPYGAAGIGQATMNGLPAAFANAIYNAIGVRLKKTPFTPSRILKALGKI